MVMGRESRLGPEKTAHILGWHGPPHCLCKKLAESAYFGSEGDHYANFPTVGQYAIDCFRRRIVTWRANWDDQINVDYALCMVH